MSHAGRGPRQDQDGTYRFRRVEAVGPLMCLIPRETVQVQDLDGRLLRVLAILPDL